MSPETPDDRNAPPAADQRHDKLVREQSVTMVENQRLDPDGLKTVLRLPQGIDFPLLTRIIDLCLAASFSITLTALIRGQLKLGVAVEFEGHTVPELPPRRIRITPAGDPGICEITGVAPKNGRDTFARLAFDWRKRSGTIKRDGTIDWKEINSVPNVNKGDLLAEIFDRTNGRPGIDVYGRKLPPTPGRRHPVRWAKQKIVSRQLEGEGADFRLFAACSGVVKFQFRVPGDPATLESLDIADTLTINGDIDYDYGDLKSSASLEIRGNLKGSFSLRSEGYVHVNGAIEGRVIDARNVRAELITNGCKVSAREEVEANSVTNCIIKANKISISKNGSSSEINALESIVFKRDAAIMAHKCQAKSVEMHQTRFSGRIEICLGEFIFNRAAEALEKIENSASGFEKRTEEIRGAAKDILARVISLERTINIAKPPPVALRLLLKIKESLALAFKHKKPINDLASSLAYELQELLADHGLPRGTLKKVDQIIYRIRNYNNLYAAFAEDRTILQREQELFEDLRHRAATELMVVMDGAIPMSRSAEIRIRCGESVKVIDGENFPAGPFTVVYNLPEDAENLRHGTLEITRPPEHHDSPGS